MAGHDAVAIEAQSFHCHTRPSHRRGSTGPPPLHRIGERLVSDPSARIRRHFLACVLTQLLPDVGRHLLDHHSLRPDRQTDRLPKFIKTRKGDRNADHLRLDLLKSGALPNILHRVSSRRRRCRRQRRLDAHRSERGIDRIGGRAAGEHVPHICPTAPPGRTTRAISFTALSGPGTKAITSAITATSKLRSSNGKAWRVALLKLREACGGPLARIG